VTPRLPLAAALLLLGCDAEPDRPHPPADLSVRSLGLAHVQGGRLVDEWGRELVLRENLVGDWYLNRPGFEAVARPYALAVPGRIERQSFDRSTQAFEIELTARGGEAAPLVYIPDHRFPGGYEVTVDGDAVEVVRDPATSRALVPWTGEAGRHVIRIHATP